MKTRHTLAAVVGAALLAASPAASVADDATKTGAITGTVDVFKGRGKIEDRKGVVVYLEDAPRSRKKRDRVEIRQKNRKFYPKVTVVVVGTVVDFPNEDPVAHNVVSRSDAASGMVESAAQNPGPRVAVLIRAR